MSQRINFAENNLADEINPNQKRSRINSDRISRNLNLEFKQDSIEENKPVPTSADIERLPSFVKSDLRSSEEKQKSNHQVK